MRELARLQIFPEDVQIAGVPSVVHKQMGNAVPSLLAEVMGREIRRQLLNSRVSTPLKLAVQPSPIPARPARLKAVPASYLKLQGLHAAHPGTGLGPGARARNAA